MLRFIIVFSMIFNLNQLHASCKDPVQVIEEGQKANCDGFLFSDEAEKTAAQARDDAEYYKDLSELLRQRSEFSNEQLGILDERLKTHMELSQNLSEELNRRERQDFWKNTLFFGLGILTTGLAIYAASEVQK